MNSKLSSILDHLHGLGVLLAGVALISVTMLILGFIAGSGGELVRVDVENSSMTTGDGFPCSTGQSIVRCTFVGTNSSWICQSESPRWQQPDNRTETCTEVMSLE